MFGDYFLVLKFICICSFIANFLSILNYIFRKHEMDIINILNIQLVIAIFFQSFPLLFTPNEYGGFLKIFQALYSATFNLCISIITTFIAVSCCISIFYEAFFSKNKKIFILSFSIISWTLPIIYELYLISIKHILCQRNFCFYEIKKVAFPFIIYFTLLIINISCNVIMIVAIKKLMKNNKELRNIFIKKLIAFMSSSIILYGTYLIGMIPEIFHFHSKKSIYNFWNFCRNLFQSLTGLFVSVCYIYNKSFVIELKNMFLCKKDNTFEFEKTEESN